VSAVFIITLVLLAAIAYSIYRKQRELGSYRTDAELGPVRPRSLFDDSPEAVARLRQLPEELSRAESERRAAMLARAREGDYTVLADAHRAGDPSLYAALLAELTRWAALSESNLRELASFVATDKELRASAALSDAYVEVWKRSPDLTTTARMLHLAALSDDADAFRRAVEAAATASREGRLAHLPAADLRALIESEFWVMSTDARVTGAGFVLKERLARLREELAP
jgi:hypothetical protein